MIGFNADTVKLRLNAIGYEIKDGDDEAIKFAVWQVGWIIKNDCNVAEIPEGLYPIAVNMAVVEFLIGKKAVSPEDLSGVDLNAAVSQIQEGDTTVTFSSGDDAKSAEERLDEFFDYLLNRGRNQFACYRRLRW